jgi:hypothetical protein
MTFHPNPRITFTEGARFSFEATLHPHLPLDEYFEIRLRVEVVFSTPDLSIGDAGGWFPTAAFVLEGDDENFILGMDVLPMLHDVDRWELKKAADVEAL